MSQTAGVIGTSTTRTRTFLAAILVTAALMRVTFMVEMADTPLPVLHTWQETDMAFFHTWGETIASGDVLGKVPLHPFHGWHEAVAREYLSPKMGQPPSKEAATELWDGWYGGRRFHQEPAYPYLLGGIFALGQTPLSVRLLQTFLGLCSLVLLFAVTRRLMGDHVALLATGLAALFGPLMFFEQILLRVTLILFTGLASLLLCLRALELRTRGAFFLAGLALGIALLVKSTIMLFALAFSAGLLLLARERIAALKQVGWLAMGAVLPLLPAIIRNLVVDAPALGFSSVGPITFINANAPDFVPGTGFFISRFAGEVMAESHQSLLATALQTMALHDSPLSFITLLARKFALSFHWAEIPNNANINYLGRFSAVLSWAQLSFWWIGLPAIAGWVLAWRKWRTNWPLLTYIACALVPMAVFYNLGRLRAPLVPFLAPFAAYALLTLVARMRAGQWRLSMVALLTAASLAILSTLAAPPDARYIREADYVIGNRQWEALAKTRFEDGDKSGALDLLERALSAESGEAVASPAVAYSFGKLHLLCAALARETGERERSDRHLERAMALVPRE
jgi:4-amino-4-deoxy-L-arabinose transferase-like glycosyltransferase